MRIDGKEKKKERNIMNTVSYFAYFKNYVKMLTMCDRVKIN